LNQSLGNQFISEIQLYDKYARWIPAQERRETWPEVTDRVMGFLKTIPESAKLPQSTWDALSESMLNKEVLPSMRIVQMAGPALERCHVGAYNCAYTTLSGPKDLSELLYILMQGTGVGYSVERKYVDQWPHPKVAKATGQYFTLYVEDTTEGWCDAFREAIEAAMNSRDVQFNYSKIRPEGAWLHTKGGRASGPDPLRKLLEKTHEIIRARAGQRLRPIDIHRLATMCGSIVQVGGVRRAAELALFDEGDPEMTNCKEGEFWNEMPELAMANNSVATTGPVSDRALLSWMSQLSNTGSGEPGIFRRDGVVPQRRATGHDFGTNPCGEIILRPHQFCNLSVAVARPDETLQSLTRKVTLAAVLGTLQSCLTTFSYLGPSWKVNCDEERLLGVDITGACDCPLLTNPDTLPGVLAQLQSQAIRVNVTAAALLGIPVSAAVTCNKPSGNSAQFLDTSSGIHARYAPYYIRRLRLQARSPLAEHLRAKGLPVYPEVAQGTLDEARTWVVELPVKSPDGAIVREDMSAVDQLSYWLMWKQHWTEHNPSCTIYVRPDEWVSVTAFLRLHWAHIGGLSFMPKDDHTYALAPYEEIDEDTYHERLANLPGQLGLGAIREVADFTTINQEYACTSGICEV
jgi:ribonucleoside-diphosphate reductase alpha chain